MKTLFVDSSRKNLSIALVDNNELLLVSNVESYNKHSNYLINEIKNILNKFNLEPKDIDNYIVLNGPGSFTGVRVGVTVCKTLAWALSKKLYLLNNLEALKVDVKDDIVISIIFDKSNASYVSIYRNNTKVEDYMNLDYNFNFDGKNITIVSLENSEYLKLLKENLSLNNNVKIPILKDYNYLDVINYALSMKSIDPHIAEPIYLKKIDVEKNANQKV